MIKIAVCGAAGKMGSAVIKLIVCDKNLKLTGAVEADNFPSIGKDIGLLAGVGKTGVQLTGDLNKSINESDVVIDFSAPEATLKNIGIAKANKKPVVVGTTGFKDEDKDKIKEASKQIPVVFAPNMSVGVNLLFKLAKEATKVLKDKDFEIEITETHHKHKKDAPSGTALKLASVIADEKGVDLKKTMVIGMAGNACERPKNSISVFSARTGEVVGDHTVKFTSDGETVELTHKALSRETFALGALVAAKFAVKAKAGLYDMQDVLNIK